MSDDEHDYVPRGRPFVQPSDAVRREAIARMLPDWKDPRRLYPEREPAGPPPWVATNAQIAKIAGDCVRKLAAERPKR